MGRPLSLVRSLGQGLSGWLPTVFVPWDRGLARRRGDGAAPVLLAIVGPPRVGSTLLYQVLAQGLDVEFVTNVQYFLYRVPFLGATIARRLGRPGRPTFVSVDGYVPGLRAPSEAGALWRDWFDLRAEESPAHPDTRRLRYIMRALSGEHGGSAPVWLTSWNAHAFYLRQLERWFDRAVFLRIRRDPVATVLSILAARIRQTGDDSSWWSLRPRSEVDWVGLDPLRQICLQVLQTDRRLDESAPDHAVFELGYSELCADPRDTVHRVQRYLSGQGLNVRLRDLDAIPLRFDESRPDPRSEQTRRVEQALCEMQPLVDPSVPAAVAASLE